MEVLQVMEAQVEVVQVEVVQVMGAQVEVGR